MKEKDTQCLNEIKMLALDMINMAGSGHPGIVLSAAPILYTLYANHLNIMPENPNWINRDRFVMSCGHGSALLYATLHFAGYNISVNDLKSFRRINSITPGHPEYKVTPGVECTTGPLGQGIGQAVGMALAERYIEKLLDQEEDKKQDLIDYYTYVLCSDGDLMEGISYEALSFAGAQKLNKLIILYDDNNMSIDGSLETTFNEDMMSRFKSIGFETIIVKDGSNLTMIDKALTQARKNNKPTIVVFKTILGNGSYNQNTNIVHGSPLQEADLYNLRQVLKVPTEPFYVGKDSIKNELYVAFGEDSKYLLSDECIIDNINFISPNRPTKCTAKFRYRGEDYPVTLEYLNNGEISVKYDNVKSVTPGQACVLYDKDECLGSGIIKTVKNDGKKVWYIN